MRAVIEIIDGVRAGFADTGIPARGCETVNVWEINWTTVSMVIRLLTSMICSFIRAIRPTLMGDRLSDFVGAVLLLVDKDEAHATQSRSCLAAPVARSTFPSGFGAALQPTIPISSHLLCKRSARSSVPSVV